MIRKLFATTILCLGLIALTGINKAWAFGGWPSPTNWGWSPGSVVCFSDWKGIGNPEQYDEDIECVINTIDVQVTCANNGDNTGGLGNPFTYAADDLSLVDSLDIGDLIGKGKASSEVTFEEQFLFDSLFCTHFEGLVCTAYVFPDGICQNSNWYVVTPDNGGTFNVLGGSVTINARVDGVIKTTLEGHCVYNPDYDPEDLTTMYDCFTDSVVKLK